MSVEEGKGRRGAGRDDEGGAFEEPARDGAAKGERAEPAPLDYGRVWRVATVALLAAAAALVFLGRNGAAFFVAGLGACAWFLNVRASLIRKHDLVKVGGRNWRPRREVEREEEAEVEAGDED